MDPDETLTKLGDALRAGDLTAARESFDSLHSWLMRGGYLPLLWRRVSVAPKEADRG